MNLYVADTHVLNWYLTADKRLSRKAKSILDALDADTHIYISTLVLAEIVELEDKGRTNIKYDVVMQYLQNNPRYTIIDVTIDIVEAAKRLQGAAELFDRLIAATAIFLEAKLITHDAVLSSLKNIEIVW